MTCDVLDPDRHADAVSFTVQILQRAEHAATLVADVLASWYSELGVGTPSGWHPDLLLGLAAVIELREWQVAGVVPSVLKNCEPWEEYHEHLVRAYVYISEDSNRHRQRIAELRRLTFIAWFYEEAGTSIAHLGVPFAFVDDDKEALLDAMAALVWKLRHLADERIDNGGTSTE